MEAGDVKTGGIYSAIYDGAQWQQGGTDLGNSTAPGLTLLGTATGGGSSYDFTGLVTATYKDYLLVIEQLIPASNNVSLFARVRRSGHGSFDSSGYHYSGGSVNAVGALAVFSGTNSSGVALALAVNNSANLGVGVSGRLEGLGLPNVAIPELIFAAGHGNTVPQVACSSFGSGFLNNAAAIDSLQLLFGSGNIASGAAYLYGYKAS
jgi:hypothetical protein